MSREIGTFEEESKKKSLVSENNEVIVEEEVKHLDDEDMNANQIDKLLDLNKQRETIRRSIIFKTAKSDHEREGPRLTANPVSIIITNIPSFKGGRANPWMESMQAQTMGIEDANN